MFGQPLGAMDILNTISESHLEDLAKLPQRRKYDHTLYKKGTSGTLAHIVVRGLNSPGHAADAVYDLRLELSLVEEKPVLIAIDEINTLYWPTGYWQNGTPIHASQLCVVKALRFIDGIEQGVKTNVVEGHQPIRGAIIGATTNSLTPIPHPKLPIPRDLQSIVGEVPFKRYIPSYKRAELEAIWKYYTEQNLIPDRNAKEPVTMEEVMKISTVTDFVPHLVFEQAIKGGSGIFEHYFSAKKRYQSYLDEMERKRIGEIGNAKKSNNKSTSTPAATKVTVKSNTSTQQQQQQRPT
jgi:hypothetical protein